MSELTHSCTAAPSWTFGLRDGDSDENDRLRAECLGCQAERDYLARIYRFEDEPLDPYEDLSWIAVGYPGEAERLRAEQLRLRRGAA